MSEFEKFAAAELNPKPTKIFTQGTAIDLAEFTREMNWMDVDRFCDIG